MENEKIKIDESNTKYFDSNIFSAMNSEIKELLLKYDKIHNKKLQESLDDAVRLLIKDDFTLPPKKRRMEVIIEEDE